MLADCGSTLDEFHSHKNHLLHLLIPGKLGKGRGKMRNKETQNSEPEYRSWLVHFELELEFVTSGDGGSLHVGLVRQL